MQKRSTGRSWYTRSALLAIVALLSVVWVGCAEKVEQPSAPTTSEQSTAPPAPDQLLSKANPRVQHVMAIQDRHTPSLLQMNDVVGTATGVDGDAIVITVYTARSKADLPRELDGVRVVQHISGPIEPKKGPPPMDGGSGNDDPKAKQALPVKMGTSGGWGLDLANGFCCGGTLGSLIDVGGTQHVLSNYHVLYSDIVSGGNNTTAQPGQPVIQPGLIDVGCVAANAQQVATLVVNGGSLPNSSPKIDAGIAAVISGRVDPSGAILNVGVPAGGSGVPAFVGQAVKKMGRTTGLGRATVTGINGAFNITYANECAGGTSFTIGYTGQIVTSNNRCNFLDGGDSGSLMLEDVDTNPAAVGLLFAGSSICNPNAIAIANPIGVVLSHYGATMVGN